jgi:hypothetical protein
MGGRNTHLSIATANRSSLQCLLKMTGIKSGADPFSASHGCESPPSSPAQAVTSPDMTLQNSSRPELADNNVSESWLKHRAAQGPADEVRRRSGAPDDLYEYSEMNSAVATASHSRDGLDARHRTGPSWLTCAPQEVDKLDRWCTDAFCIVTVEGLPWTRGDKAIGGKWTA